VIEPRPTNKEDLLALIDLLLGHEEFEWAADTLVSIQDTVKKMYTPTSRQIDAVLNIRESKPQVEIYGEGWQ